MARKLGIGHDDFAVVRESNNFYVDKTNFIREWWESNDKETLITRPRRFGKTLNMSMLENFFSLQYAGRGDLFEGHLAERAIPGTPGNLSGHLFKLCECKESFL